MIKQAYKTTEMGNLYLYVFEPAAEPAGCVLCIHGGGWRAETPARLFPHAEYFASLGAVGVSVGYRLLDGAGDVRGCLEDCADALKFVRERWKGLKITVLGDSAGGYLAACLGCAAIGRAVRADFVRADFVVDLNGIADLTGKWSYAMPDQTLRRRFSPLYNAGSGDAPALILHGDRDVTVDPRESAAYCRALKRAGVEAQSMTVAGAGHAFILFDYRWDNERARGVLESIGKTLKAKGLI